MKNYLIVGGSSGIGSASAKLLSEKGNKVIATYNTNQQSNAANLEYHPLDVLSPEWNLGWLPETLDGLVYCPGTIQLKPFHRFKEEDLLEDYRLQVLGATRMIRECLPALKKSEAPSIVLFSTVAVQKGYTFHTQVSSSKGAIEGLTRALAAEFAPRIRVNAVAPSLVKTPLSQQFFRTPEKEENLAKQNPMKRLGEAQDIAHAVEYLLGPQSSWMTGQILSVDGGASALK